MVPSFLAGRCGTSRYIRNPASDVLDTTTAQALQWLAVVAALPAVNSITNNIVLYCTVLYQSSPAPARSACLAARRAETSPGADLGGSSKYSNENFED